MKPTRNLWPYGVLTAFLLFGIGMTTVVTIAVRHPETLVSDNYYENEVRFQQQIDSAARAQKAGAEIRCDAAARQVVIALPAAQLAQKFSGTVVLYRPNAPEQDRSFALQPLADGTQTLNLAQFATGQWLLKVSWEAGGEGYYLEQRLVVPAS